MTGTKSGPSDATAETLSAETPLATETYEDVQLTFRDSPWFNWKLIAGTFVLAFLLFGSLLGQLVWNNDLAFVASSPVNLPPVGIEYKGQVGTWDHPLGTENSGRDMLSLLVIGVPRTLLIGFLASLIGTSVGVVMGFTAGYLGGWWDNLIRLATDITMTIPALLILIILQASLSSISYLTMALLLAMFSWQGATRVFRAQVLAMKRGGYVQLAQLSGASAVYIMFREILPNLMPYLVSSLTFGVSFAILTMTGIEVLGLGAQRIPSLGVTLNYAINAAAILRGMWWWWLLPTITLVITFISFLLITVGMDEVANPRLRDA
jgi:peptide/nickel transport system permease protein